MARVRTVDFLPEIFRTPTNKQFLSATLDQLVQEPAFKKTQGFVGRRVGPGVNADDKYVVEPTASRTNYQLEPGVILKEPNSDSVKDAITYPGIGDALSIQGAFIDDSDRLYTSDYYTWDPFIDFDKFVNFSQYYWLPEGPDAVDITSTSVPLQATYDVTRENGVYTFSDYNSNNPVITLVRGGNYKFNVAQNNKETINYRVTNNGSSAYVIDYLSNPTLTLVRGNTYVFNIITNGLYPFWIKTQPTQGRGEAYNTGVLRNGAAEGNITFTVPQDAPDTLYYSSENQFNMQGVLNIVNATPGTGPGFWIQTSPGVDGRIPTTPNISSRDVLGVINNGEDLGIIEFNVPSATAQNFYYSMTSIAPVDFATNLKVNQINNQRLDTFIQQYGGIDGVTNLNGRTLIFLNRTEDTQDGGWELTTQFDPIIRTVPYNETDPLDGFPGTFDVSQFDQTTPIDSLDLRYSVWQIQYQYTDDGTIYLKLSSIRTINRLEKFNILFGDQYASTQWYKNASGYLEQVPLLSAIKDVLYYQDGTDPGIFGEIRLIEQDQVRTININDIIGKKNYTSPTGVVFTNGLKVQFQSDVFPSSYANQTYYVEGVGTAIQLLPIENFVTPEPYTESSSIPYDSLLYDEGAYDAVLGVPLYPDYLTINRASPDLNGWTRSNRWFHIDVINASAEYNNTVAVLDNNLRGKRPILEYQSGLRLFNFGTEGKQPINVIDFEQTDALSEVNGQTSYEVDGYSFIQNSRVIFANDDDPRVKNKIYIVNFIEPDLTATTNSADLKIKYLYQIASLGTTDWNVVAGTTGETYQVGDQIVVEDSATGTGTAIFLEPIINLVEATDGEPLLDQTVVCIDGDTLQGKSFWFDGSDWLDAQDKTKINQSPLFNIYDNDGVSFSDAIKYPSTTFTGSKLFSYAIGTGLSDTILGFPLKYLSLTNVGDIVFDNNLYTDTFVYVVDKNGITANVSNGLVRQYASRTVFEKQIGWQNAITKGRVRQQFQFTYDGSPLLLDVRVNDNAQIPSILLFVANKFQAPDTYSIVKTNDTTKITLNNIHTPGDIIEVQVLSDQVSKQGFYDVPENLENNPFNINSDSFTLGTIRAHYETIGENLLDLVGPINGANNSRDLGNISIYGTNIVQQSSPLTLAGFFMRSQEYNIFKSLEFNDREYIKFKSKMLETVVNNDWGTLTPSEILDEIIIELSEGKTDTNSFYWSDMIPAGNIYTENIYTVSFISTGVFDTLQTYDFTSANFKGLLVFLNGELLTLNYDYIVSTDGPRLTITVPLSVGDKVTIREYSATYGNFIPNTPTKLGLYPAWKPAIYSSAAYINETIVIQGHDGSITVAFGDIRDDILLEFERRIFNNLKVEDNPIPLGQADVIPGYFRTTDYSRSEITEILGESFLTWVGWNKLDYKTQQYNPNNPFTYNYSAAGDKEKNQPLLGATKGNARYFYDTVNLINSPWEMLGLTQKPDWWEDRYGPAPYTSDNLVLWDDIESGYVADSINPYYDERYARPNLVQYFIPVNSEGQPLPPITALAGQYDPNAFKKSWVVGDGGPVEAAWWTSSSYPFAVMRLLALTRPAEFFALFADRDLYKYNSDLDQYLYNNRYRLDANGIEVYGNGVSKASYINWIVDYNQQLGINSTDTLETALADLDVRLCWRMASFTDKQYLKIFTERSSPDSLNSSLLLPDESYNILLYKNTPFSYLNYSSVIVQSVDGGYAVYGYSTTDPYFNIFASRVNGNLQTISAGGTSVRVPRDYSQNVIQVPYGFVFSNQTVVVDFLLSYGRYLEDQGLIFDNQENGFTLNWNQMAQEFLYWSNQGWATGALINLNPAADRLVAERPGAVVDSIVLQTPENQLMDQNRQTFDYRNLVIERLENKFSLSSANGQAIAYIKLQFVNYESMVVLDNVSIFNDLIFDPATGARQNRINVTATTTTDWNGTLDAQGFILNQNNVSAWRPNRKYTKGEIVLYKNTYWSAQTIIQPKLEFDYNDWVKSDYTAIQKGLLPNIANKADQLANTYSIQVANIERDNDLLSYGLIGFKPREYMTGLNLDDVSQVNLYQQFLGSKGTVRSAEIFKGADLNKEVAEYDIFENWAVKRGTYGANANRRFVEMQLNEALLQSDPSTVEIIVPGQSSQANQSVEINNLWRESFKVTSPEIYPTTTVATTDTVLPSAGYVNVDDVDITVFSLNDPSTIAENLDNIGVGTKIWVAKTNAYDWNVYRCNQVPGRITLVSDNLDGSSTVTFTKAHELSRGDLLIIRFLSTAIDGVYRVLSTPKANTLTIAYTFENPAQVTFSGNGIGFFLQSMRVAQASDLINLPYTNDLIPGALAWVDNNGLGQWTVLEKQNVFTSEYFLNAYPQQGGARFGAAIAQALDSSAALVGAVAYDSNQGAVYPYGKDINSQYVKILPLLLQTTGTSGYGHSVSIGNANWMAAGAPNSNTSAGYLTTVYHPTDSVFFTQTQLLVDPEQDFVGGEFGYSVTISRDERWMYVGSPDHNKVHAYGRFDIQSQSAEYSGDGSTTTFDYAGSIIIDQDSQLTVLVDNQELIYGVDYTVVDDDVEFTVAPADDSRIIIARSIETYLDQTTYLGVIATGGTGSDVEFTVDNVRGVYSVTLTNVGIDYTSGDTLTIAGTSIGGSAPANNITITILSVDTDGGILDFSYTGSGNGSTSVFDIGQYLYNARNIYSFSVYVNEILQRPYIDYTFNSSTLDLTFVTIPVAGASIRITSDTYWKYVSTIDQSGLGATARFGHSLSSTTDGRQVIIGSPNDDGETVALAGAVYVYDRSVQRYLINDVDTTTFELPAGYAEPVAVLLNGTFLTNADQFINGQFTVSGGDVILESNVELAVGDVIEIESNIFNLVQKITAETEFDEGDFGYSVDICSNNCSIYIGSPQDGSILIGAGSVQRNVNQSRIYGVISNTIANPSLTAGRVVRVNDYTIEIPASPNNTVAGLADAINSVNGGVGVPNVLASVSENLELQGNGSQTVFNIGETYSQHASYNPVVYVDSTLQILNVDYTYNNTTENITFVAPPLSNQTITVITGILTLSIKNSEAAVTGSKLTVLPGVGGTNGFDELGFENYAYTQTIVSPLPVDYARFGSSLQIDTSAVNLVVGAERGNTYEPVIFDDGKTYFDDRSTIFSTTLIQSGSVYTYDFAPSAVDSISNPGKFVFGQQIYNTSIEELDEFGYSVNYTNGVLLVGSPGNDAGDSTEANFGSVSAFVNENNTPAWTIKHVQQPSVDISLINSVYMYDKEESTVTSYLDFFNPLQGKILGVARQNIDYIGAVDPASYNQGPIRNNGTSWGIENVGEIWWDTNNVRFIDPNQDNIVYSSRRWGQVFPGSSIDVYQWIESDVIPAQYTGPGVPLSSLTYTIRTNLNIDNIFVTRYYFWVRNISTVDTVAGKKLSTQAIANYIENPRSSGIPYMAPLNSSTVGLYNVFDLVSAQDTILHVEFDQVANEDNIHTEYELIAEGREDSFLSSNLYLKLIDSFSGVNYNGAPVPDTNLSPAERYGVSFKPRQSMFADRYQALQNYLQRANSVLKNYPVSETRKFNILNSSEPIPSEASGEWNLKVANIEELGFQNIYAVSLGYRYLVESDSTNDGLWSIYQVVAGTPPGSRDLLLYRVQTYDTKKYWNYVNWYLPGYNSTVKPVDEVANYAGLGTLNVPIGSSVKVTTNAQGKFEIYLLSASGWERVGLEDGTIEFSESLWNYLAGNFGFSVEVFDAQYFDQDPVTETRKIIQAINEELFIDDLAIERNRSLILMFNFILSEFEAPDWLFKTSLIDVDHKIRDLVPYQIYRQDNQSFVLDYIQEVKPYHTQIREFNLTYDGFDQYLGSMTDFDLPAYYDTSLLIPQYISPVLVDGSFYTLSTANSNSNEFADTLASSTLWDNFPYNQWYNNFLLSIENVVITNAGAGYTVTPEIVVTGDCITPAEMTCVINSAGQIFSITIVNPGEGYSETPSITFVGGNGYGASAAAVMGNSLVRNIKTTIKYDRYQYDTTVLDWEPNVSYDNGTLVRYLDRVWAADSDDSTAVEGPTFDPDQWNVVNPASLSGVDRTMGLYVPTVNEPGLSLPLLIDGVEYPGVQVFGTDYITTYDDTTLDAIYESPYLDPMLGTRATDINVDGGAYIDTYSSFAPEELVPGSEFDTLDLRVYTTPGADWARDGHGFKTYSFALDLFELPQTISFEIWYETVPYLVTGSLYNETTGRALTPGVNYTVDWIAKTFTVTSGVSVGDRVFGTAYGLGGGNQLYRKNYFGNAGSSVVIPVAYDRLQEIVVWANGLLYTNLTYAEGVDNTTVVTFGTPFTSTDVVVLYAIGPTDVDGTLIDYSWSAPVTQYIEADGGLIYNLTNSLEYTNPVNLVVTVNGIRARTAAGAEYYADGSSEYALPQRLGFSQNLIADTEVLAYLDDVPQILGIDYFVEPYDGITPRSVIFADPPGVDTKILICVTTNSQALVNGNQIEFVPTAGLIPYDGDVIAVTTWNDTRQQGILTQVYVGPVEGSSTMVEGYDDTLFDFANITNQPGSFDYSEGQTVTLNNLFLNQVVTDPTRLIVTLNGVRLFVNKDFLVVGTEIVLGNDYILNALDVVMITEFTNSITPDAMAFRIFQDMRGVQATYRITDNSTTYLVQPLSESDDVIYVHDVSTLSEPNLSANIWGVLTINGERIMYRSRNITTNTVSGLLRGTAGTGIAYHAINSVVYDIGRGNLLPVQYQDRIVSGSTLADGVQTRFIATDINLDSFDSTSADSSIEVYIGGTRQFTGFTVDDINPATVLFAEAPALGSEVTILVRQGEGWYQPAGGNPSDGVALQDTETFQARFLRGEI